MKTKRIRTCVICSIVLIVLLLISSQCIPAHKETPMPSTTPSELLVHIPGITEPATRFPCSYGTWDTLQFGVTTEEQFVQWIAKSKFVHQPSLGDGWKEPGLSDPFYRTHSYSWLIVSETNIFRNSIGIDVISGTLSSLRTSFFYPLTLQDTVAQLGYPELIAVYLVDRYEECAYSYELYYLAQGIRIGGSIYDNDLCQQIREDQQASLEATWPVTDLSCSRGGTAEEIVGAMYGVTPEAAAQITKFLQPWSGFGQKYPLEVSDADTSPVWRTGPH